jgi:alanyl-tRNA synthetase
MVAISGFERFKGGLRVEFVCGGRALQSYRALDKAVTGSVRLLSVLPEDLPSAIEKLQTSARAQQKAQDTLVERLAVHEADSLASAGEKIGSATLVAVAVPGWDANGLKRLASAIASRHASIAVLLGSESPSPIVVTRSQDLSIDAGVILKKLIERFGGKGGGKGGMAQGGGLAGDPRQILDAARDLVKSEFADS